MKDGIKIVELLIRYHWHGVQEEARKDVPEGSHTQASIQGGQLWQQEQEQGGRHQHQHQLQDTWQV
jgi:hypothetical protein